MITLRAETQNQGHSRSLSEYHIPFLIRLLQKNESNTKSAFSWAIVDQSRDSTTPVCVTKWHTQMAVRFMARA